MVMSMLRLSARNNRNCFIFFLLLLSNSQLASQKLDTASIKNHIIYLSSDSLAGRMTGSLGEKFASDYIVKNLKSIGCLPCYADGRFLDSFQFVSNRKPSQETELKFDQSSLILNKEFQPILFSKVGSARGAIHVWENATHFDTIRKNLDYIAVFNKDVFYTKHPHADFNVLRMEFDSMASRGIKSIILLSEKGEFESWMSNFKLAQSSIPIVCITDSNSCRRIASASDASLKIAFSDEIKSGSNICGFLPGKFKRAVLLGAHYDHLGVGQESSSSLDKYTSDIHHGADDNASGVSLVMELSKALFKMRNKNYTSVFAFFSGEELGLLGSKHFLNHQEKYEFSIDSLNYMLNFDMVGRLKSTENNLLISGTGTSVAWDSILSLSTISGISIKKSESGIGPSDHTSFYFKGIPALHYFTGPHSDYHKPSDTYEKINYSGIAKIGEYVLQNIANSFFFDKLIFQTTKSETTNSVNPTFKVTLGIVPDYSYDKVGVRIDGVIPGKIAERNGLKGGDIIIKLNHVQIKDIQTYMYALSTCAKGQKAILDYLRGEETITVEITF